MKRLFMLLCAVVALAACEQATIKEMQGAAINERNLEVSFEGDDDTRIQLQGGKTVWTEGDHVSVFYRSTVNEEWQFMGETGDRTGQIVPVDNSVNPPATHNHVVVAYPYSADYFYNTETHNVEASLPAEQSYLKDSYGTNGNIMISSSEFNKVSLKSVCGWLKLQLTGDGEVVKSVTLRGNDGEQVAGLIYVDSATATATLASASGETGDGEVGGTLVRPGTILTEVTLDCGEGVALGKNATAFYIALPPQTFEEGFTVDIECDGYIPMTLSTTNTLTIERNHIQPMASVEHNATPIVPNNQIWYTSSDGDVVTPRSTYAFGANIISNTYDNGKGVIIFDGDVTTIGNGAFQEYSSLISVNIPDSVTTIGDDAFVGCYRLTSVNIPDSVTTIGNKAFALCTSLTSVNIPDSVTMIGSSAFKGCDSLTEFNGKFATKDGRCLIINGVLNSFAPAGITEYTIPNSVTTIGDSAFEDCTSLTSVNIPDSVTTIGEEAFYWCDSLTSVTIGDSVTTIGDYAFYSCNSLTSVYCKATTPPALSGTYVFDYNGSGRKIYVPAGSVEAYKSATNWNEYASAIVGYDFENGEIVEVQPNNEIWYTSSDGNVVTPYKTNVFGANIVSNTYKNGKGVIKFDGDVDSIGNYAFYSVGSGSEGRRLTSVITPNSVTSIGNYAFQGCNQLTSVNISNRVTSIGDSAFAQSSLTSVTIPDSITEIGDGAFNTCSKLTGVTIPNGVTSIGKAVFVNCKRMTRFSGKFASMDNRCLIIDGVLNSFAPAELTEYTIPDSVTEIGENAFWYCTSLTSVNIPDGVTSIGDLAFWNCTSLTSVYCKATTPPALGDTSVFDDNGSGRTIYVPAEAIEAYKSATRWNEYASAIVGYDFENGMVVE